MAELYFESLEGPANPSRTAPAWPAASKGGWLGQLSQIRRQKLDLDLVRSHVEDCFDPGMRHAIGADAARVLPLLDTHPGHPLGSQKAWEGTQFADSCCDLPVAYTTVRKRWAGVPRHAPVQVPCGAADAGARPAVPVVPTHP